MLFTVKSYRAFAALVGLFLLVVQVAAAPPKVRKTPPSRSVGGTHNAMTKAFKDAHRDAHEAHRKAKQQHTNAHDLNMALARQHEEYAKGLKLSSQAAHHRAAAQHKERAQNHKDRAQSHDIATEKLPNIHHIAALQNSKIAGEWSASGSKLVEDHTTMLSSAMTAANEHVAAITTRTNAARLAGYRNRVTDWFKHLEESDNHAAAARKHSKFAVQHVRPKAMEQSVEEKTRLIQKSANDARGSNALAQQSIERDSAALGVAANSPRRAQ